MSLSLPRLNNGQGATAGDLNSIKGKVKDYIEKLLPSSAMEFILFVVMVILVILISFLIHYTIINRNVKKYSRCYREKQESNIGQGMYKVSGFAQNGDEVYEIIYDMNAKEYIINQKCEKGPIVNKADITVYDIKRKQTDKVKKIFECSKNYELNIKPAYHTGEPGLVRFIEFGDAEFFYKLK